MNETQIGQLVISLRIKTEALEENLETAKHKLQNIEQENKNVENSNNNLEANYSKMSSTAVRALSKIGSVIKDCVNEYNSYTQAMSSLQNVSEYTGQSMQDFSKILNKFGAYMTKADLATTIKNFSLMGMSAKDTEQMIEALTNSAIRNRNANYTVSEAVRVASEGYRQGLSTLSDSAGVTENLSVMLDNYARSIGKTAGQLTEAEKNQAYLNRTMYAAEPFAGAMADYMDSLAGKQGQYSQTMRETQVAYAEAIEPIMNKALEVGTQILEMINSFITEHPILTQGITTFAITLGTATVAIIALKKAKDLYSSSTLKATIATKGFTKALMANPIFIIASAIALVISGISMLCTAIKENEEAQEKLNEVTERYKQIKEGSYSFLDENISEVEQENEKIKEQIKLKEEQIRLANELSGYNFFDLANAESKLPFLRSDEEKEICKNTKALKENQKELKKLQKESGIYEDTLEKLNGRFKDNTDYLEKANALKKGQEAMDIKSSSRKQQEAVQLKKNVQEFQNYLSVLKKGETGTKEYGEAYEKLSKEYPEAVKNEQLLIEEVERCIGVDEQKAEQAWKTAQDEINSKIATINKLQEMVIAAENSEEKQKELADNLKISYENLMPTLTGVLSVLNAMAGYQPEDVKLPETYSAPKTSKTSGGSKSYSNKALDNYKKEIEHKKALDQISLEEEIAMYEKALKSYAKTQDEKWELEEKIYDLRKEAQEKEYSDYNAFVEHKKAIGKKSLKEEINDYEWAYKNLAKTTEQKQELEEKLYDLKKELQEDEYNNYVSEIQYKKSMDKISLKQEIEMYEKALKDYAKTSEQKKEIRQTLYELNKEMAQKEKTILDQQTEDYEIYMQKQKNLRGAAYDVKEQTDDYDKIIKMHKNYLNQIMKDERLSLDERKDLYREELATIRSYEEQKRNLRVESIDNTVSQLTNAITKQLEEMQEKDKELIDKNLEAVEKWKNARIEAINEEYDARIEAINKELEALNKSEQQKTRDEEDAEHERKKKRLEELIAFEHDAVTKANYQKELDKLIEEYQKTLDKRALDDKKEALNTQKELLKEEQDSKVQAVEEEAEKKTEIYDKQLEKLEAYYEEQIDMAQQTAEKMLLNVGKNQDKILSLLKKYGDKYELTGQSLGEKLAQGINEGLAGKIESFIQKFQDTIDKNLEAKIKQWTASNYKYEAGANKPQTKTVNVTQINKIEQNPEMPSETYRKLNNVSQKLATEFAGM